MMDFYTQTSEIIIKEISKYYGLPQSKLIQEFGVKFKNRHPKNIRSIIAKSILKECIINTNLNFDNVLIKSIRINNKNMPIESLSFSQIKYNEIVNETWESSTLFKVLSSHFLFFIFKIENKIQNDPIFISAQLWKMNESDLDIACKFWELTKDNIIRGDYKNFITIKNNFICHIRTKGLNSKDLMKTPQGTVEPKRGYWMNASYLKSQLF